MSRQKLKMIRDERIRDRGYPVYTVTCPRCYCKLEKLRYDDAPTNCPSCRIACIPFVQWNAERLMAEIDLMSFKIFCAMIRTLAVECQNNGQFYTSNFLWHRLSLLKAAIGED